MFISVIVSSQQKVEEMKEVTQSMKVLLLDMV